MRSLSSWPRRPRRSCGAGARVVRRRRTPDPAGRGAGKEPPPIPGHPRGHRNRSVCCGIGSAQLRPGEPILGEEGGGGARRSRRRAVGARPDRRNGELPLRRAGLRRLGGRPGRRGVGGGRGGRRGPATSTPRRRVSAPMTLRDGVRSRLHCSTVDDLSMAWWAPDSATRRGGRAAGRAAGPDPAGGARCPAHWFGGAGPVPGRRRTPRRPLRARAACLGLGGGAP